MENELSRFIDALPGLVWTAPPDGHIDFVSQRWCQYTGFSADQAYGQGWQTAIHPEDLPELLKRWRSSLASGEPLDTEARLRRFDGEYRWFVFRACPLADASKQVVKWYGINTDIDERKRSMEGLREREDHYRSIADSIPALIAFMTPAGEVESVNRHVLEYFGATLEEMKNWAAGETVHPDDLPGVIAAWRRAIGTGEPYEIEHRIRRADGVYRWFHVRGLPLRDTEGRIARWYVLETDINDRKRAESLLAGEKRLLEMIATGESLSATLTQLCLLVPELCPGCVSCSILLLDPDTGKLWHAASPRVPKAYTESIDGFTVGPDVSSCGTAAYHGKQAIASDIATDSRWADFRDLALENGLRACWSTPIISQQDRVLGTFAMFSSKPSHPTTDDQEVIAQVTHLASIAIEREQSQLSLARALDELRKSESRLRTTIDAIPGFVWSGASDGNVDFLNQRWCDYTGVKFENGSGSGWQTTIHFDDVDRLLEYWRSLLKSGQPGEIEARLCRFDGTFRWFLIRAVPLRDEADHIVKWYGLNIDIEDLKQAEEKLRKSELNLRQMTETIPEMLWSASPDGAIDYLNARVLDYTGFSAEQLMGAGWQKCIHPNDAERVFPVWMSCISTGAPYRVEVRTFHAADRTYRLCVTSALPLLDQQGRILKWHGTIVDMHDWKQAEEDLRNTQAELAHMTRVLTMGELTASIAHEVNQPLSGIITNASTCLRMLAADPPNVDGARETARRTIRDGNRASEVITRLRALFSKKEATTESMDLNEAAREVIALSLGELQRNSVILRPELAEDLPLITGDRVQLQQVILNLLRNASDAMNGVDDRPRRLLIRTERDEGDRVRLIVQDAGVGFEPQGVDKLFKAFYTTKNGGMGIGLSVSRSIIENHHGRLWAAPNDGPGATFSFSIPLRAEGLTAARSLEATRSS